MTNDHSEFSDRGFTLRGNAVGERRQPLLDIHSPFHPQPEAVTIAHFLDDDRADRLGHRSGETPWCNLVHPPHPLEPLLALILHLLDTL